MANSKSKTNHTKNGTPNNDVTIPIGKMTPGMRSLLMIDETVIINAPIIIVMICVKR